MRFDAIRPFALPCLALAWTGALFAAGWWLWDGHWIAVLTNVVFGWAWTWLAVVIAAEAWSRRPWKRRPKSASQVLEEGWRTYLRRKFDDEIAAERARDRGERVG